VLRACARRVPCFGPSRGASKSLCGITFPTVWFHKEPWPCAACLRATRTLRSHEPRRHQALEERAVSPAGFQYGEEDSIHWPYMQYKASPAPRMRLHAACLTQPPGSARCALGTCSALAVHCACRQGTRLFLLASAACMLVCTLYESRIGTLAAWAQGCSFVHSVKEAAPV